jgi:hypothetical protein
MFNQFRSYYPQGSLVTELAAIDHGMYIVRCLVQVEGTTLVTGMAAAHTVELAEDQARNRALAVLGMDSITTPKAPETPRFNPETPRPNSEVSPALHSIPKVPATLSSESLAEVHSTPSSDTRGLGDTPSFSSFESKTEEMAEATVASSPRDDEMSFIQETVPQEPSPPSEETPLWQPEKTQKKSKKSASTQNKEMSTSSSSQKQAEVDLAPTPAADDTPIDFSDIIARTNVELKRLGWTTQQGKEYLLQTYGKRSRQLLTDGELLDFLHYLESVPAPE